MSIICVILVSVGLIMVFAGILGTIFASSLFNPISGKQRTFGIGIGILLLVAGFVIMEVVSQ